MNRKEAVEFLHNGVGYSRRMSAKLVDFALAKGDNAFSIAMNNALEKSVPKYVIDLEKSKKKTQEIYKHIKKGK